MGPQNSEYQYIFEKTLMRYWYRENIDQRLILIKHWGEIDIEEMFIGGGGSWYNGIWYNGICCNFFQELDITEFDVTKNWKLI